MSQKSSENSDIVFEEIGGSGKIKVLYLPLCNSFEKQNAMRQALGKLFYTYVYDFRNAYSYNKNVNKRLLEISLSFKPDIILCQLQFSPIIHIQTIIEIKNNLPNCKLINWTGDIFPYPHKYFTMMSNIFDVNLISSTGQLQMYKDAGTKNLDYWQIGYDNSKFYNMNIKRDIDIAMVASRTKDYTYSKFRDDIVFAFLEKYDKKFRIWGSGYGDPLPFYNQREIYNRAKIVLSVNNENTDNYFSDRQIIAMSCGPLVLTHRFNNKYWKDKKHLVYFDDIDDALKKADFYLKNEKERNRIGICGSKDVLKKHTYDIRAIELKERFIDENKKYDLSVCIGTKNRNHLIKKCIKNIFKSANNKKIEIIICNCGDNLNINKKNVKIINGTGPLSHDYNLAFSEAKGKYITWLSDDIICEGNALSDMIDVMETLSPKDMGAFIVEHENEKKFTYVNKKLCPTVGCVNTETFKNIGMWNEEDYPIYGADIEFCNRIYRLGGNIVKTYCVLKHLHEQDDTRKTNIKNNIDDTSKFYLQSVHFGKWSDKLYPKILFYTEDTSDDEILKILNMFKKHYKNAFYYGNGTLCEGLKTIYVDLISVINSEEYDIIVNFKDKKVQLVYPSKQDLKDNYKHIKFNFIKSILDVNNEISK